MAERTDSKIQEMSLEIAERGMTLVRELSNTKGKGFTDGYHKYVGDLVSAMNATRSALQTALVQQALVMRAAEMPEVGEMLKLAPKKNA